VSASSSLLDGLDEPEPSVAQNPKSVRWALTSDNPEAVGRIKSYADRIFDLLSEIESEGADVDEIAAGLLLFADRICEDYDTVTH
jgi:hypothetical protein